VPEPTLQYLPAFKRGTIRLGRSSDRSDPQIAAEIGGSDNSLRSWVNQVGIDQGEREGLTTEEREELRKLRGKNKVLRQPLELRSTKQAELWFRARLTDDKKDVRFERVTVV
jgi:transposase